MSKFFWKGIDEVGREYKGYIFAESQIELQEQLLERKIALLNCKVIKRKFWKLHRGLTQYDFIDFFDQLAILLDGGVDILSAIKIIEQQNSRIQDVVTIMRMDLEKGESFSTALSRHSDIFSNFIIRTVEVGQCSGRLSFILSQITKYLSANNQLRRDLSSAAFVPAFTMFFSLLIVLIILVFVVPQFEIFFNMLDKKIPTATQRIIKLSGFLRSNFIYILIFSSLSLTLLYLLLGSKIKMIKTYFILYLPYFSKIFILYHFTYFFQSLVLLLHAGIPLKDAISYAQGAVGDVYLKSQIDSVIDGIVYGRSLSESIQSLPTFYKQENLVALIKVGEQSGNLVDVLNRIVDSFQKELKQFLLIFTSFFQPALLIFVGLIIGFLIWLIYLPIFNLAYSLN